LPFLLYRKFLIAGLDKKIKSGHLLDGESQKAKDSWMKRSRIINESSDIKYIKGVEDAGKFKNGWIIMHNGLKVNPFCFYGLGGIYMIMENKGMHEPQEERVFEAVIKSMREGAVMLELGSYWAFYSMWFSKIVKNAKTYLIEPDGLNLKYGSINMKANGLKATAVCQAFVGASSSIDHKKQRTVCIDDFVKEYNIPFIDILHSDIQGYELDMLKGAINTIEAKKIGYVFISTHSNDLHAQCLDFLNKYGFISIASANRTQSYSYDGVLVMRAPYYDGIGQIEISLRGVEKTVPA
jgi:hypothetical protein